MVKQAPSNTKVLTCYIYSTPAFLCLILFVKCICVLRWITQFLWFKSSLPQGQNKHVEVALRFYRLIWNKLSE